MYIGGVLVHCKEGISRSATTVISYLMQRRAISYVEALQATLSRRPVIKPNAGFSVQLQEYDIRLQERRKLSPLKKPKSPGKTRFNNKDPDHESEEPEGKLAQNNLEQIPRQGFVSPRSDTALNQHPSPTGINDSLERISNMF